MQCKECKNLFLSKARTIARCQVCGEVINSETNPPNKVCKNCSTKYNICEQCGNSIFKYVRVFSKGKIEIGKYGGENR